jgi:hypothetical protein
VVKLEVVVPQERAEELVRRLANPSLVESRERHHVSFHQCGERRVLQHRTSLKLRRQHKPMLHEFLQMAQCNSGKSPVLLRHGTSGREE